MDSAKLHAWVYGYNWDDGLAPMWLVAESGRTEFATALMVYWLLGGPALEAEPGGINFEANQLQDLVRERLIAGYYQRGTCRFDPDLGRSEVYKMRKAGMPDLLLLASDSTGEAGEETGAGPCTP